MENKELQTRNNDKEVSIYLPSSKSEAWKFAESYCTSSFCPPAYKNKPTDVFLAMAYGDQMGINPLLAICNIAVINAKPAIYGDALIALVNAHPETEHYSDGEEKDGTAWCKITRKGRTVLRKFSIEDAKTAGLWGSNVWKKYPKRMLLMRARGFAIRDLYADVLVGLVIAEEAMDMPRERNISKEKDSQMTKVKEFYDDEPEAKEEPKPEAQKKDDSKLNELFEDGK